MRQRLYHRYQAVRLFLAIVWRVWDEYPDGSHYRLSARTAWSVARGVWLED